MSVRLAFCCVTLSIVFIPWNIAVALDEVDLNAVRLVDFDSGVSLQLAGDDAVDSIDAASHEEPLIPPEAQGILDRFEADAKDIRRGAAAEIDEHRQALITILQAMQDRYTRDALLDEAVAIRDQLLILRFAHLHPKSDPGNLTRFARRIGQTFYFTITGAGQGAVWGTDVYTCDSNLAAAAVHAGALKIGRRGVVKVTIVDSPEQHVGTQRHGVGTLPFGPFRASYKIERAHPTDVHEGSDFLEEEPEEQPNPLKNFGGLFLMDMPKEQPQLDLRPGF